MRDQERNKLLRRRDLKKQGLERCFSSGRAARGLPKLGDLGICDEDLCPGFLLGCRSSKQKPLLASLVEHGYLGEIPARCLTRNVVLALKHYPIDGFGNILTKSNCLQFCASVRSYGQLPRRYHEREFVCGKGMLFPEGVAPLMIAACKGTLYTMPLHDLKPGDIDAFILFHAQWNEEIELIDHLLLPSDINLIDLSYCFSRNYLPQWVRRNLTPEVIFAGGPAKIVQAVSSGWLRYLPVSLFTTRLSELCSAVDLAKTEMAMLSMRKRVIKKRIKEAEDYLVQISHVILSQRGRAVREHSLRLLDRTSGIGA